VPELKLGDVRALYAEVPPDRAATSLVNAPAAGAARPTHASDSRARHIASQRRQRPGVPAACRPGMAAALLPRPVQVTRPAMPPSHPSTIRHRDDT
jgi:hypothetical protein